MHRFDSIRRTDADLLGHARMLAGRDRETTADLLADLGEIESRGLHRVAGHSSMFAYCVDELGLSEDAAYKRIQVARAARKFPALLDALADGRLHLTGANLLVPHLTPENFDELLDAAKHARKSAIEEFLSRRFPRMEALLASSVPSVRPAAPVAVPQLAPAQVEVTLKPKRVAPAVEAPAALAPALYDVRATIGQATHAKLEMARSFLRHSVPNGDFAAILDRALDALLAECEKTKCAATTSRPRRAVRPARSKRHVPAAVKRAVWQRDGGRCTFVGAGGRRCGSRDFLEFDHVEPVARGGGATVDGARILCRAHNALEAERVFGASFMAGKRRDAAKSRRGMRAP
jgi:5-methylcytosine-specific restriction endonuclease McrA